MQDFVHQQYWGNRRAPELFNGCCQGLGSGPTDGCSLLFQGLVSGFGYLGAPKSCLSVSPPISSVLEAGFVDGGFEF